MANELDYSNWTVGWGSITNWTGTGNASVENERLYAADPWGKHAIVWKTHTEDDTGYGGGWWSAYFTADTSYTYRFTCYVKRLPGANGERTLFGCNAGTLIHVGTESTSTNPYFQYHYNSSYIDEWLLYVGHINYYGYSTPASFNSNGGVWRMSTQTKIENADYEWAFSTSSNVSTRSRIFYYDSADKWPTFSDMYCYPRIDKLDGTEPSMASLFRGPYGMFLGPTAGDLLIKTKTWH